MNLFSNWPLAKNQHTNILSSDITKKLLAFNFFYRETHERNPFKNWEIKAKLVE